MAKINVGDEQNPVITSEPIYDIPISTPTNDGNEEDKTPIVGLTSEELNDPNKISITIADKDAPIVVLFGPPECGKTMILVRLTRFLSHNGYTITPVRTFRPTADENYSDICENFNTTINDDKAAKSTDRISFMLVKVSKNGRTICQILEAPGEYYFDAKKPNAAFPRYFNAIKSSKNRKIWTILVEPDWMNESDRLNYVDRIKKLKTQMATKDRAIIVFNKIDFTEFLIDNSGNAHIGQARKNVQDLYPNIFDPFRNTTPIVSWLVPYRLDFAIFQTGDYHIAADGTKIFEEGPDVFPQRLWEIILKKVRG